MRFSHPRNQQSAIRRKHLLKRLRRRLTLLISAPYLVTKPKNISSKPMTDISWVCIACHIAKVKREPESIRVTTVYVSRSFTCTMGF